MVSPVYRPRSAAHGVPVRPPGACGSAPPPRACPSSHGPRHLALFSRSAVGLPPPTNRPSWQCWGLGLGRSGRELAALPVPRRPCSSQAGVEARDLTRRQPGGGRCQLQGHMGLRRPHPHPQNQGTQDNCSASLGPVSSSLMWGDRHPMSASLT